MICSLPCSILACDKRVKPDLIVVVDLYVEHMYM